MTTRPLATLLLLTVGLAALPGLGAAPGHRSAGAPPEGLSAKVSELLAPAGIAVTTGERVAAEFWLRREIERREGGAAKLGVEFGAVAEGSLVGVVRFPDGFEDYMGSPVAAGTYTMRYGAQPADGNHMGVSIWRDFLLLVPAAEDADPKPLAYADLVAASRKATGSKHPGVLSLFPVGKETAVPSIVRNELDQPMLAVETGGLRLGLVFEGEGEH